MSKRSRSETESLWADKVPARAGSAIVGLTIGGPVGAVIGSAMAPVLELILQRGNQRYVDGFADVLERAASATSMTPDDMIEALTTDDALLDLAVVTARASLNSITAAKLQTLSAVLALGIKDEARLDLARLFAVALSDLEAPHVRVMHELSVRYTHSWISDEGAVSKADLHGLFPQLGTGLDSVTATLVRLGLAVERQGYVAVTEFGFDLYGWIRCAGADPSTTPQTSWGAWGCERLETIDAWVIRHLGVDLTAARNPYTEVGVGVNRALEIVVSRRNYHRWQDDSGDYFDGAGTFVVVVSTHRLSKLSDVADGEMRPANITRRLVTLPDVGPL